MQSTGKRISLAEAGTTAKEILCSCSSLITELSFQTALKKTAELTAKAGVTTMADKRTKENYLLNSEGYPDPTAYACIKKENNLEYRFNTLIKVLKSVISLSGFELISRIEIRDKNSGTEFR